MAKIKDYLNSPLINAVVDQIKKDLEDKDETAICELLSFIPEKNLINFLPEEQWSQFKK
jgi:hypothetical protein